MNVYPCEGFLLFQAVWGKVRQVMQQQPETSMIFLITSITTAAFPEPHSVFYTVPSILLHLTNTAAIFWSTLRTKNKNDMKMPNVSRQLLFIHVQHCNSYTFILKQCLAIYNHFTHWTISLKSITISSSTSTYIVSGTNNLKTNNRS